MPKGSVIAMFATPEDKKQGMIAIVTAAGLAALAFGVATRVRSHKVPAKGTDWLGVCDDAVRQLEGRICKFPGESSRA